MISISPSQCCLNNKKQQKIFSENKGAIQVFEAEKSTFKNVMNEVQMLFSS